MAPKRASEDEPQLMNKIQRIEHHGIPTSPQPRHASNDFSGSVKRRLADSKRTGQACDRCKVRKIRCDGRPEGCTPCEQNRTPCRTTDRITGRATTRGQVEAMEAETNHLRAQIADLRAQLKENGIEPRPTPAYNGMLPLSSPYAPSAQTSDSQSWTDQRRTSSPLAGYAGAAEKPEYRQLPQFKHKSIGDNYLGVGAADARLSHIRGTSLSIFGTDINITDYMQGDVEYEKSVMSYSRLLDVALGSEHVDPVPLPPYQALTEYATWYLRSLNPYTMLVYKPTFMELITKIGTEPDFRPTPAQKVNVHMMLATIQYQIASRNSQSSGLLEESHKHYAYSLSLYKELLQGRHTIHDIQALTMICHHLRNFPKPGAAWIMTSITYLYAIELGLHRSVRNWKDGEYKISKQEIEMRKRVFWTLNALMVNLTGKLGRPMPISNDDIDVEFPEPINDCLPGEDANLDEFHQCSFQVGIQIAKYTVWEVDLYKLIYSVRASSSTYLERMKLLEAGIKRWKEELPPELRDPSIASADNHIFALYLEYWYQSFILHLHHPAVCRSTDPAIQNANLDRCLEASQKMLQNCKELMLKKSLDIPWINTVVYIAAIFTTLYIQSLRYVQLTPADMAKLKADMATWITVIAECDHFLGSENRLRNAIAKIVEQSLSNINSSIVKRTASESLARVALQNPHQSNTSPQVYPDPGMYRTQYPAGGSSQPETSITPHAPSYSNISGTPYNLGDPVPIPQQTSTMFNEPIYSTRDDAGMASTHVAALTVASSNPTQANETYAYAHVPNSVQHAYASQSFTANDWRQWGRTYVQPQSQQMGQPGEYLNTATTLMALGGRDGANPNPGNEVAGSMAGPGVQGHVGHTHWPEMAYPGAANGHMS